MLLRLLLAALCVAQAPFLMAHAPDVAQAPSVRPHDPFVLRCALDGRPRVVVVALHEDLWVAYDAPSATLYKAWRGDVDFQGAVYTTEHGPQPRVRGDDYGYADEQSAWSLVRGPDAHPLRPRYDGYRLERGRAVLRWKFARPSAFEPGDIELEEIPEHRATGGLTRRFTARGVPEDWMLQLTGTLAPESAAGAVSLTHGDELGGSVLMVAGSSGAAPSRKRVLLQLAPQGWTELRLHVAPRAGAREQPR